MLFTEMNMQFPWVYFIFTLGLSGCASPVNTAAPNTSSDSTSSDSTATSLAPSEVDISDSASFRQSIKNTLQKEISAPFSTKYAHFEPASFTDLPGWEEDKLSDAWLAFRQSCSMLHKRKAWVDPCERSARLNSANGDAIHRFFEQEFKLYQIQNKNRTPAGVITGYYEPLLTGSRKYGKPNIVPVYASPDDMLYLNVHSLPAKFNGEILARIEGKNVIPLLGSAVGRNTVYRLDLGRALPDIRTKLIRLRVDGQRIVPYYSRREIEHSGLPHAKVILWVDNSAAFYSMQIQGSGKVRLPNGNIVRLAYSEQNGHPFLPSLRALPMQEITHGKKQMIVTRGIGILEPTENNDMADTQGQTFDDAGDENSPEPLTRSIKKPKASEIPDKPSEVERMIEALSVRRPRISADAALKAEDPAQKPGNAATPYKAPAISPSIDSARSNTDPSYVFFREIPDNDGGPIGAMGVQLTPGRSIAVDPRTTPLGFPVFISTTHPEKNGTLNRLVLAQDTGGAIRGAVRADYFWGFGEHAFAQAIRMKETGKMWLLLPKKQEIPRNANSTLLRGARSLNDTAQQLTECVVPDPELCVE